jgi:GNAT superfamily N-acetyltransferase
MRARLKYTTWNNTHLQDLIYKIWGNPYNIDINREEASWIVYYLDSVPVAFAGLGWITSTVANLELTGVLRSAQGQGIQKKLIRARERQAKRQGAIKMITYTDPTNCASINSLIACGYKSYRPQHAWAGKKFLYWWKKL